jgi:hypothetical protein
MPITFECQACGKSFSVPDHLAGKKGSCKQCGSKFQIPTGSATDPYAIEVLAGAAESEPTPEPAPVFTRIKAPAPPPPAAKGLFLPKPKKKKQSTYSSSAPLYGPGGYNGDDTRDKVGLGLRVVRIVLRVIFFRGL